MKPPKHRLTADEEVALEKLILELAITALILTGIALSLWLAIVLAHDAPKTPPGGPEEPQQSPQPPQPHEGTF